MQESLRYRLRESFTHGSIFLLVNIISDGSSAQRARFTSSVGVRCVEGLIGKSSMSVTVPVYHYGILKGYLLAHGATAEVLAALEALYSAACRPPLSADLHDTLQKIMGAADRLTAPAVSPDEAPPPEPTSPPDIELPPLTRKALEMANQPKAPVASFAPVAKWEDPGEVVMTPHEPNPSLRGLPVTGEVPAPKPRKPRAPWTEEQKEAARARMAKARAAKAARHHPVYPEPEALTGPDSPRLLGPTCNPLPREPEPPTLNEDDWAEIQQMLVDGRSREAIAGDYEVEVEELDGFIAERLETRARERHEPGEALALSAEVGSAA